VAKYEVKVNRPVPTTPEVTQVRQQFNFLLENVLNSGSYEELKSKIDSGLVKTIGIDPSLPNSSEWPVDVDSSVLTAGPVVDSTSKLIWRPDATGANAPGGNVYVGSGLAGFQELYDAIEELRPYGEVVLEFDHRFSNTLNGWGEPTCEIPARPDGMGGYLPWDMFQVKWYGQLFSYAETAPANLPSVIFEDNCTIVNLTEIMGTGLYLYHDGEVNSPIICPNSGNIYVDVFLMANSNPNAKAIIAASPADGGGFLTIGGNNVFFQFNVAPLFDCVGETFVIVDKGARWGANAFADSVGGGTFTALNLNDTGWQGAGFLYDMADFPVGSTFLLTNSNHIRHRIPSIVTNLESPYSALLGEVIRVDTTGGVVTVTLPDQQGRMVGEEITIKDFGGNALTNNITISPSGTDTIDGAASDTIAVNNGFRKYISDGSGDWMIVASE